jgi:hypothetical protein
MIVIWVIGFVQVFVISRVVSARNRNVSAREVRIVAALFKTGGAAYVENKPIKTNVRLLTVLSIKLSNLRDCKWFGPIVLAEFLLRRLFLPNAV